MEKALEDLNSMKNEIKSRDAQIKKEQLKYENLHSKVAERNNPSSFWS